MCKMSLEEILMLLHRNIKSLQNSLAGYVKKKDANQLYIDNQNKLIADLIAVYNYFEPLQDFEPIFNSISKMESISNIPDDIGLISISYRIRPKGDIPFSITLNPFK